MSGLPFPACVPRDCHENVHDAVAYWLSIHPAEGLPGRQHFDPIDVPRLLPFIRLIDVVGDPPRFRVRLMGTRVAKFYGQDFTGHWYDKAFPTFAGSEAERSMTNAVRTACPEYRNGPPNYFHEQSHKNVERVTLPLASDGRNVDMLLIVHTYEYELRQDSDKPFGEEPGLAIAP